MDQDQAAREAQRIADVEAGMRAQGIATEERVQEDYFGFSATNRTYMPDGVSFVEHKVFTEGDRRKYLNKINRDVVMEKVSGNARIHMAPGDERYQLLKTAIIGWNLVRNGQPVPFNERELDKFLAAANPKIIDMIEKDVRLNNPWLLSEMSVEDIEREIESLQEMLAKKREEEEGNGASANK